MSFLITEGSTPFVIGDSFTFYTNNGNYGNGWVSTPTTGPATLAENWTLVCVDQAPPARFSVTSTSSGIHADAVVHTNYSSNNREVVFLITAGSTTAFAVGDIFTFNTINATVGNGTVSEVTTGPATTSGGWTLVCVDQAPPARFSVTSTSSGIHADVIAGQQYSSDNGEVSFLITEGSTPFVVSDSFYFTTQTHTDIRGMVTYHEQKTAILTPSAPLNYAHLHNAQIGPIQDLEGNSITHVWSFTTVSAPAPDGTSPTVVATSPNFLKPVEVIAPLHLPHGAKIRKLSVYGDNPSPAIGMHFFIFRTSGGYNVNSQIDPFASPAEEVIGVVIPAAAGETTVVAEWTDEEGRGVIDNETYSYSVMGFWGDHVDFDEYLYRVWIDYEITSPLP